MKAESGDQDQQLYIEEDFCECFKVFKFDPERLKDVDEIKYNFIKNIYSSLKNREE